MSKRLLAVVIGTLALCSLLAATPQTNSAADIPYSFALYQPDIFRTVDSGMLIDRLPVRGFLDGTRLPFSTPLGRMGTGTLDFPSIAFVQLAPVKARTPRSNRTDGKDFSDGKESGSEVMVSQGSNLHYGGELGVFYGQDSGKYGGDAMGTYLQGTVGNDHFELTVGASHQEWNVNVPHGRH